MYKVNGIQATEEQWEHFRDLTSDTGGKQSPFSDKELTLPEIEQLLNANHNSFFYDDFSSWQPARFDDLAASLSLFNFYLVSTISSEFSKIKSTFPEWQIPALFWSSRAYVMDAIEDHNWLLDFIYSDRAKPLMKNYKTDQVEKALTDQYPLKFASPELKGNREVALKAVGGYGFALRFVDESLRGDKEIVLAAVSNNGHALEFSAPDLKSDEELVLAAVKTSPLAFQHAAYELKRNPEFVGQAAAITRLAYANASPELLADRDFIRTSVIRDGVYPFAVASSELQADREIALLAIARDALAFQYVSHRLQADRKFVLEAVNSNGGVLSFVTQDFRNDRVIVLASVTNDGKMLAHASPRLKSDRSVVLAAATNNGVALEYADPSLLADEDFCAQIIRNNIGTAEYIAYLQKKDYWPKIWPMIWNAADWSLVLSEGAVQNYQAWKSALKDQYNIEFISRFRSMKVLFDVLQARKEGTAVSKKPLAVLVYPKSDFNLAFEQYPLIDRMTELGYEVVYYEASHEIQVREALEEATQGGERKAAVIIFGGHGTANNMRLDDQSNAETVKLDVGDFGVSPDIPLADFIAPEGDVVLYSCSNGEGGEKNPHNMANTISAHLPAGVALHSSTAPANIRFVAKENGRIKVYWTEESLYIPERPPAP